MRRFSPKCLLAAVAVGVLGAVVSFNAAAVASGCKPSNTLGTILSSPDIAATSSTVQTADGSYTTTYKFDASLLTSSDGSLIEYCVYPSQPPGNPDSAAVDPDIASTAGATWGTSFKAIQGYFAFGRATGNDNIPFGNPPSPLTIGSATWCQLQAGACTSVSPDPQTIALHINDPVECDKLYGGNPGTCFVTSCAIDADTGGCIQQEPPPQLCNGNPACKDVLIDEADSDEPYTVPAFTLLHLHYIYTIVNQPTNTQSMVFKYPPSKNDVNYGGFKDYFGCEQIPDPAGSPGAFGTFYSNQPDGAINWAGLFTSSGWKLNFVSGNGTCNQSSFFGVPWQQTIVLLPGDYITFTVDMLTRKNKGGKQEFTSCGDKFLNSGFTVKWYWQDPVSGLFSPLQSFSTNPPLTVDAVGPTSGVDSPCN